MGEKKLPRYLTSRQLREEVVDWTDEQLKSRVHGGFPGFKDDAGRWVFPTAEVLDYLKRRNVKLKNG